MGLKKSKLAKVICRPKYAVLAALSGLAMLALYIYTQLLGIIENFDLWLTVIPPLNAFMLIIFTIVFGITFAYQVYIWQQPKTCSVIQKAKGTSASSASTFGIFLVAQCPACASLSALFLPLSAITFIAQYSWVINLIAIAMMVFTLNYLGAFKNEI